ncbi:DHA2 family multidrug resistance protein-like MFS transporter [Actinoplanes tereljensis]|uniref:MFS transporter n=1 Tax=Paractinoplanes tereljensis TaxID=571912 RepID=A0A919NNQ5_9ACTN|nr:MFS transporter [Actinoplanes tereljensis]GIF21878.1 MFS transporter [Actinoplanes tereljensis]
MSATARSWAGLAVLALPCLLVSLDAEVLYLATPQLTADLRPSSGQLLWIMDSYVFVVAGALIAMGVLGDRIGRRRLLLIGAGGFGGASLLAAFAASPGQLIAARVLMGLAGASLMPSTLALIRTMFPDPRARTVALGVWSASFSLGGIAAPLVGGTLLAYFWWGSVFVIAVPAVLLLLALGPVLLPESRDGTAKTFDVAGALQSLAAVLLFVYGVKRLAASGWQVLPLVTIGASVFLFARFLRRQRRIAHPLLDLAIFRDARTSVALACNALSFFVHYGSQIAIAQYLQLALGLSALQAGLWTLPSVLAYLAASFLGPALARWVPAGYVIAAGLGAIAVGLGIMAVGGLAAVVTGAVVFSVGLAPAYILTTDLVVSTAPPARAGMAAALAETGCELGGALGIALLGSLMVAVYRGSAGPALGDFGLRPDATFGEAVAVAATLPGRAGELLLGTAVPAYASAFSVMALTAAVLTTVVAALAAVVLRPAKAQPNLNSAESPREVSPLHRT